MKFITIKKKTTLTELTREVFALKGSKASVESKNAQLALREANPHLADLTHLSAGTLVIVPDVLGLDPAPLVGVSLEVVARLQQTLAGAKAVLDRSVETFAREAETSVSLAKSRAVINLVKQVPALRERRVEIGEQMKIQRKQMDADKKLQLQSLAQLGKNLDSVRGNFS